MSKRLLSSLLYAALAIGTPAISNAQEVKKDTTQIYTMPPISVTTDENSKEQPRLEGAAASFTRGNANWKMYLTTPEMSSAFPGFSPVSKNFSLGGNLSYRYSIPLLSIRELNYSLVPDFYDFPVEKRVGLTNVETTAADVPFEISTTPIQSELFFEINPLQISGGFGYNSGTFKAAASGQILGALDPLPRKWKDYLKPFGKGRRGFAFGEFNGYGDGTLTKFSVEGYNEELDTDLAGQLNVRRFDSHDLNRYFLGHFERKNQIGETLETTVAFQSGSSDIEIARASEQEKIHQDMSVLSVRNAVRYLGTTFSMAFHSINKTNTRGANKKYFVTQTSADQQIFLTSDLALRLAGRLDVIAEETIFPRASVYGSLEKRISNFKLGLSGAFLQSATNNEILRDPLTEFSPSPNVGVEQIMYGQANLGVRLGKHLFKLEAGKREVDLPLLNEAKIRGYSYFLSYSWENDHSYLTAAAALRFFRMTIGDQTTPVYLTPREEFKLIAGTRVGMFDFGSSLNLQADSYFPLEESGGELEAFNLGKKVNWMLYSSGRVGVFSFGVNLINIFELSEKVLRDLGIVDNFGNNLAVYGEDNTPLEMPWLLTIYLRLLFEK